MHPEFSRSLIATLGGSAGIVTLARATMAARFPRFAPQVVAGAMPDDTQARGITEIGVDYLNRALAILGFGSGKRLCLTGGFKPVTDGICVRPGRTGDRAGGLRPGRGPVLRGRPGNAVTAAAP